MNRVLYFTLITIFCTTLLAPGAETENTNYLIVNLTSYTTPGSRKAIDYAKAELQKGRPVIIYLEEDSVRVAAKSNARHFKDQQQHLAELMKNGAIVAVCPHCLKYYHLRDSDLLPGVQTAELSQR
jgi:sulfur relay (sulfurtransferase) complex TusBCD TusD component (DsrE family)